MNDITELICKRMQESIETKKAILQDPLLVKQIAYVADVIVETIRNRGKLLICGNGGSASDALHFAGELVGRFQKERAAWPALVLNADVSTMTAIANDYAYEDIFARQVEAHAKPEDLLIGISTSGNSENVWRAVKAAKSIGTRTVGLLGNGGGKLGNITEAQIIVPSSIAARIQESHIAIIHILCEIAERTL